MTTVQIGVRLGEDLVRRIDAIADQTGVTRTFVIERCIRIGLKQEEEAVEIGPIATEVLNLMMSEPFLKVASLVLGNPDPKQVERFKHLRENRKQSKKRVTNRIVPALE